MEKNNQINMTLSNYNSYYIPQVKIVILRVYCTDKKLTYQHILKIHLFKVAFLSGNSGKQ